MKEQTGAKTSYDDIIALLQDIIGIFSDSLDKVRNELLVSQEKLKDELREEIRAARYESKMADEEITDELRSFKYEMKDFRTETNETLADHTERFENIQQDIILLGGLEARVSRLEKVRS